MPRTTRWPRPSPCTWPPRRVAEELLSCLELEGSYFSACEIAGPGFLNFRLAPAWYAAVLNNIISEGDGYGRSDAGHGERVMVEFVSANPTGPMTIGNARGGVLGDALASVLDRAGYDVYREFYVNDAGNQVDLFGRSIEGALSPALPRRGRGRVPRQRLSRRRYPRACRHDTRSATETSMWTCRRRNARQAFVEFGLPYNIERMKRDLERYRIKFDNWFLESSLHSSGYVAETVQLLTDSGLTYEKDGALWLKNTELGADKDEVLRRANGFYTYYAVDIAYHRNKFVVRSFDRVIDVWGRRPPRACHTLCRTMKAPALGLEGRKLDFLIMQMVRLVRGSEVVKVSNAPARRSRSATCSTR